MSSYCIEPIQSFTNFAHKLLVPIPILLKHILQVPISLDIIQTLPVPIDVDTYLENSNVHVQYPFILMLAGSYIHLT